ncbi:hypothetical protein LOTGIDRAFT_128573 [Lottia gigantea]|uniref:Uncharacterized protein n=1 Tax=Lottia gigantea TaxID=225164 RepID=V4BDK7_LOTGI|nr:hypothetical protein LOTGIDRAFT_128573 [Lottia gigantea]ESO86769.1 hypothetical protein LOTGIDRAFT_128573 [Lottia gigantea]
MLLHRVSRCVIFRKLKQNLKHVVTQSFTVCDLQKTKTEPETCCYTDLQTTKTEPETCCYSEFHGVRSSDN